MTSADCFQYVESVVTKDAQAFFPYYFTWASQCEYRRVFSILKEQQCLISQTAGTPALILNVPGSSQGTHEYFPNSPGKPQAMAILAATCQICSSLSTVPLLCSCLLASKCFPGTILLSNPGPSEEEKVKVLFFPIRNCKNCMCLMNMELSALGCCLVGRNFCWLPEDFKLVNFHIYFLLINSLLHVPRGNFGGTNHQHTHFLSVLHFLNLFIPL